MNSNGIGQNVTSVPVQIHGRLRPHVVTGAGLIASKGLSLFHCDPHGDSRKHILKDSGFTSRASRLWMVERVLRAGFHGLYPRNDREYLAVARKKIFLVDLHEDRCLGQSRYTRGSRPLNIVTDVDGRSYFGEYFGNPERRPVRIFGTDDGISWSTVHEFKAGTIRHIHGIFRDDYRGGLWVLTGDDDDEAGLWFTNDSFQTLEAVVRGTQQSRAVTIFSRPDGLIIPMDAVDERNFINHLDVDNCKFETLAELPGSSLASTSDGNCMLVSTAVERSPVNRDQRVSVFGSLNGVDWRCIARWQRDLSFTRRWRPYLQHPTAYFADGDDRSPRIYGFGVGIRGLDGKMFSWGRSDLAEFLDQTTDNV